MLAFAALLVVGRQHLGQEALAPIAVWNASIIASLLELQGIQVLRQGAALHHAGGFSCRIDLACTGLPILALGIVAVALYPATARLRIRAVALGLPLLFALNLLRMVHLMGVGIKTPVWFDFAHDVAWPEYASGGSYLDRESAVQTWQETCNYWIRFLSCAPPT